MTGAARMKDQDDFDLDRFVDMFDQALTSRDERVTNALRSLMMMVILTAPETGQKVIGPLRRVLDDQNNIIRRLDRLEMEMKRDHHYAEQKDKYYKASWNVPDTYYSTNAAQNLAQSIDREVLRQINSGLTIPNLGGKSKNE